uniref:Uncharacterized protein n=1 Tax=Lotharella oceanica TaxID=641309 RepID=A0A140GYP7_9EUKA|nr:hypothetical protein AN617_4 [Lotharella oceanica]AMN87069.1 hypothetical protein AN617_4 [Lotharella oceanica]
MRWRYTFGWLPRCTFWWPPCYFRSFLYAIAFICFFLSHRRLLLPCLTVPLIWEAPIQVRFWRGPRVDLCLRFAFPSKPLRSRRVPFTHELILRASLDSLDASKPPLLIGTTDRCPLYYAPRLNIVVPRFSLVARFCLRYRLVPLASALVLATLVAQSVYDNSALFYIARLAFCAVYAAQSIPLLFFSYGTGWEHVRTYGPCETVGGHEIPPDVGRRSVDVCVPLAAFEGDLFTLGIATPKVVVDLRERGLSEEEILSMMNMHPLMAGTLPEDFWYRVGFLLGLLKL